MAPKFGTKWNKASTEWIFFQKETGICFIKRGIL